MEQQLRKFFDLSLDLFCIANAEGYFIEVNPAFTRTLGWSREELLSRPLLEFVHAEDQQKTVRRAGAAAEWRPHIGLREPVPMHHR